MKELWSDFKKWVHYVLDYKDNTEYLEIKEGESKALNEEIERLKGVIDTGKEIIKAKDLLIDELIEHLGKYSRELNDIKKDLSKKKKKVVE